MSSGTAICAMGTVVKLMPITESVPAPHWNGSLGCLMPADCTMVMMPATMMEALIMYSFVFWSLVLLAMMVAGVIRPARRR